MTTHLSARLSWHENGWNGRVCSHPKLNAACMAHEHIREGRDDDLEQLHHDKPFAEVRRLTGYLPPCQRDANAFGSGEFVIRHDDPLPGRNLPSVEEEMPAYSSCPTPYRWMLE